MPTRKTKNKKKYNKKSRKRKAGYIPEDLQILGTDRAKRIQESMEKQKRKQKVRKFAEEHFDLGPKLANGVALNPHIPFHLGERINEDQWKGDGYYQDTEDQEKGYCFQSDGTPDPLEKENKKKITEFATQYGEDLCCGMGEVKAYDLGGNLIKDKNGEVIHISAPKVPNILTGKCDDPINFTNNLCSGGEVYLKQHNKALCCPLGQTPDIISGECREDLGNTHPEVVAKRAKRIADKTGITKVSKAAVKGATIVAAGGLGSCFIFPPCAIVVAIALCIGLGMTASKIYNYSKDKKKLQEIIDNGHSLLARLGEIQANVDNKYEKEDSIKASGLLARIRDCSRKLVKQPTDIGDDFMAQLVGEVPKIKKNYKGFMGRNLISVDFDFDNMIKLTGLIVGTITECCDEKGNKKNCGENTHVKVKYVPRPDNLKQTLLRTQGNNANNVRLITAFAKDYGNDKPKLENAKKNIKEKKTASKKEYEELLKLVPGENKDKILDKNTLSSRGGTGFVKVVRQMFHGRDTVRKYNNAMNEIQALIEKIDSTDGAVKDEVNKAKENIKAIFKDTLRKIQGIKRWGHLNLKQEQIYPITFKNESDFNIACSKFAKPETETEVNRIMNESNAGDNFLEKDLDKKRIIAQQKLQRRKDGRSGKGGKRRKSRKKRVKKTRRKSHKKRRKSRRRRKKSRRRRHIA